MGSDPTAAGGGRREGREWPRSAGDEGGYAEDIRRAPQQGLGLSRRPKGEADWIVANQHSLRFPLGNPHGRLYKTDLTDNSYFNHRRSRHHN